MGAACRTAGPVLSPGAPAESDRCYGCPPVHLSPANSISHRPIAPGTKPDGRLKTTDTRTCNSKPSTYEVSR